MQPVQATGAHDPTPQHAREAVSQDIIDITRHDQGRVQKIEDRNLSLLGVGSPIHFCVVLAAPCRDGDGASTFALA